MITRRLYLWLFVLVLAGCKSDSMTNEEKLAGKDEKTWEAKRETDAAGEKDKLTREEKKQTITFWRNGNVKMGDGNETLTGQWSLQGTSLSLVFANADVSENFTVLALDKDEIKLRAADGSEMIMEPD